MPDMWSLGGLSPWELLKRTARECWQDDVFGHAARLAFYHFLAIFPALLLLLIPLSRLAGGGDLRTVLAGSFRQFLPADSALLVAGVISDLNATTHDHPGLLLIAALSAVWAGFNAAWTLIVGLNTAYEAPEKRNWREKLATAGALALAVVVAAFAALVITHWLGVLLPDGTMHSALMHVAQFAAMAGLLLISFALFYRFGPALERRKWQWSTPGAVFAALLWIAATLLLRAYFDRFSSYRQIFGRALPTAVLIMWLYMTNAAALIGAEMNSEMEKAKEQRGSEATAREPRSRRETNR